MAELHGAVLTGDEGVRFRDRDLDICAEGTEVPIGVADIHLRGVAIDTDAIVAAVQSHRERRICQDEGRSEDQTEGVARNDGHRHLEPRVYTAQRADGDSE